MKYTNSVNYFIDESRICLILILTDDRSSQQTTLNNCSVTLTKRCYSVSETPTGLILVGRDDGFDICNSDGRIVRSVNVSTGHIVSIQYCNSEIYTLCMKGEYGPKRYVLVFNSDDYSEVRRWSVPDYKYISNIAVSNNKVYVSDTDNKQLCVYSLTGTPITNIKHSTFSSLDYLSISTPDSILISDWGANKVHKLDSRTDTITWTCTDVSIPRGVCCDTNGDVWVWSKSTKSIYILSSQSG